MALSNDETQNIYDGLKYNFLFNNDINCIHILLNLYDLENNINNIFPRYVSMNKLRKSISKLLKNKRGNYLIAYNLSELIHDDVNRLELFLYVEGYKQGFLNNKDTNGLENIVLKYYSISDLYNIKFLYHYDSGNRDINKYKERLFKKISIKKESESELYDLVYKYSKDIIKPKIMSLNNHLDKQMRISLSNIKRINIEEDSSLLTKKELKKIYKEVFKIILKNGEKLYKEAYWNGINDRLLERYK